MKLINFVFQPKKQNSQFWMTIKNVNEILDEIGRCEQYIFCNIFCKCECAGWTKFGRKLEC